MTYGKNSSIPKRSLPLNSWVNYSLPSFTPTKQWGAVPRDGIATGGLPSCAIPQKISFVPTKQWGAVPQNGIATGSLPLYAIPSFTPTKQWGAVPQDGIANGSLPLYGIPQETLLTPTTPSYGGGGGSAWIAEQWRMAQAKEDREKILADDREIFELIGMIFPHL